MTQSEPSMTSVADIIGQADALVRESAEVLQMLAGQREHPLADLATHLLELYMAGAKVAEVSAPGHIHLNVGTDSLPHTCSTHIDAALLVITAGYRPGPEAAVAIARAGFDAVRQLMAQ